MTTLRRQSTTRSRQPRPLAARISLFGVMLAALAALIAAPAASALEWGTHQTLSAPGELTSNEPSTAMDANGDAVAAWSSATGPYHECPCAVRVATRTAGQAFGAPATIATSADEGNAEYIDDVGSAMDSAGDTVVVWDASHEKQLGLVTGYSHDVYAAVRPAGGSFGAAQKLSSEGAKSDGGGAPQVTMDSAGDATIAWISGLGWFEEEAEPQLQIVKRPGGGSFTAAQALPASAGNAGPWQFRLATSPDGHAAIAFSYKAPAGCSPTPCDPFANGTLEQIKVATASPGAAFGSPVAVSPQVNMPSPSEGPYVEVEGVAIDDGGDVVASYEEGGAGGIFTDTRRDELVTRDGGGGFSAPTSLGAPGKANAGEVAIGPDGESTVTLYDANGVEAAWRAHGGSFGPTQAIGDTEAWLPALAEGSNLASGNGDVLAAMPIEGGGDTRIAAALRPAGGSFEAPVTVEQVPAGLEPTEPDSAIDASGGSAVVVWGYYGPEYGPGTIRAALTGAATGGEEHTTPPGSGTSKTGPSKPAPVTTRAVKCKKGFKKKQVHGKARCVKVKKHRHAHKKH